MEFARASSLLVAIAKLFRQATGEHPAIEYLPAASFISQRIQKAAS